jgi:hypothetical protein
LGLGEELSNQEYNKEAGLFHNLTIEDQHKE